MSKCLYRTRPIDRKPIIALFWALIFLPLYASPVYPHSGGLDSYGCHHDRKRGGYHCHRGMFAGKQFSSKEEMRRQPHSGRKLGERAAEYRTVRRVVDGDTLVLENRERVRLIGVDTPETKHPQKPVEHFGREASAFTRRMVQGKRVWLEFDQANAHIGHKDKYGRTLAYIFLENGTFLNAEIISQGYGHAYTRFPFKYLEEFRQLERVAREQRKGLWETSTREIPTRRTPAREIPTKEAPTVGVAPISPWECPATHPIKGNFTTYSGERCIYHVRGGQFYDKTKPEKCYQSAAAARADGCRASRR